MSFLETRFGLRQAGSSVRREFVAGSTSFCALSYVLFVQPALLAQAGMDAGGVLFATCVASAFACFLMGWFANHPFALAPAMGHNAFFVFTACGLLGLRWQEALAANLLSGLVFVALSGSGLRERVMELVPEPVRRGVAAGIGLLIALLGLQWGGVVVDHPATLIAGGRLSEPTALLFCFGLLLSSALVVRRVPGAILLGLLGTAAAGWLATRLFALEVPLVRVGGLVGAPPSPASAWAFDFGGLFARPVLDWVAVVLVFLLLDLFDTVGTLLGLAERSGSLENGRLPRARAALFADAAGTVAGCSLGTSTVTSYVESAAGIQSGGRTGLTALVVGGWMLLALFFAPLIEAVGAGVPVGEGVRYPVIAPVLVLVGAMMMGVVRDIDWEELGEAIPAFLTLAVCALTLSITDGLAFGFLSWSLLCLVRGQRCAWGTHLIALVFLGRFVLQEFLA